MSGRPSIVPMERRYPSCSFHISTRSHSFPPDFTHIHLFSPISPTFIRFYVSLTTTSRFKPDSLTFHLPSQTPVFGTSAHRRPHSRVYEPPGGVLDHSTTHSDPTGISNLLSHVFNPLTLTTPTTTFSQHLLCVFTGIGPL
jgi:hypothetical protein